MRKEIISVALLLIITAFILGYAFREHHIEETTIHSWDPITPSLLYPYPQNTTGWAFMSGPYAINGTFLELNISASDPVRVIVGKLVYTDPNTKQCKWDNVIFNQTGKIFDQKVEIAGKPVDFLMIINECEHPVNLSGNIKKTGSVSMPFYPYSGFATMIALLGLTLFVYGILAKPYTRRRKKKNNMLKESTSS